MKNRLTDARILAGLLWLLLLAVFGLLWTVQSVAARPHGQVDDILPPSATPYELGFADPNDLQNWNSLAGSWALRQEQYYQDDAGAITGASFYRRGIADIYSLDVTLAHISGRSGGVIINARASDSAVLADVVRYRPEANQVEIGHIEGDGNFARTAVVSVEAPAADETDRLLRVEVGAEEFSVLLDGVRLGTYGLTNRPNPAYVGLYTNQAQFRFGPVSVRVGTEEQTGSDLDPQAEPHLFPFAEEADLTGWLAQRGQWSFGNPGYVQTNLDGEDNYTVYDGRINGNFTLDVSLAWIEGQMGGGVIFNGQSNATLTGALLVAFDPAAEVSGGAVMWGYFDENETFQQLGREEVEPPVNTTDPRTITVDLADGEYTLTVDGVAIGDEFTLPAEVERVASPYFGLYATASQVRFTQVAVTVTESTVATATPTSIPDTPTPTATATETPIPPAGSLLPRNDPYTFDFRNMSEEEQNNWSEYRGNWVAEADGYTQNATGASDAIVFYKFKVYGDYVIEVDFRYLSPDATGDVGAGLVFNAPNLNELEKSFLFGFRGLLDDNDANNNEGTRTLVWGFFRNGIFYRATNTSGQAAGQALNMTAITDGEQRTLRLEVEGNGYRALLLNPSTNNFDFWGSAEFIEYNTDGENTEAVERIDEPYIGLYAHRSVVRFENARIWVEPYANPTPTPTATFPPTPTRGPTPTPDPNALEQSPNPYRIGFSAANSGRDDSISGWNPVQGQWGFDRGYVVDSREANDSFSTYNRAIGREPEGGDYTYEVNVQYLDGEMGAGVFFNAPTRQSLDRAIVVRFVPDPAQPQVEWGYFRNGSFTAVGNQIAPSPNAIKEKVYNIRVSVTSDLYSVWIDGEQIVRDQFLEPESRHLQPYVGVYTSQGSVRFTDAIVNVTSENLPTPTATPTTRPSNPTNTPVPPTRPSSTPTPTYTHTPGSVTPTMTPLPGSPTATRTPVVIAASAAQPTATQALTVSTPQPATPSLLQLTETAVAATVTTVAGGTATAQFQFDQQTAAAQVQPTSPMATPSPIGGGAGAGQPGALPPSSPLEPATATPTPDEVAMLVVTNTPPPTPRPIEPSTPLPPVGQGSLLGQVLGSAVRAAFWLWFLIGSIVFFAIAGLIFGLSMARQPEEPYALLDADDLTDLDQLLPPPEQGGGPAAPAGATNVADDDNWPASLP
jgi:hypothetical protein